jgi:DNA invertase Pin-like site-specific DNA recombinase
MLIGYARVSTEDQSLARQRDALCGAGCEEIFEDRPSGAKADWPVLKRALERLRADDTLIVWRLDRLGRSLKDLIGRADELREQGVGLRAAGRILRRGRAASKAGNPILIDAEPHAMIASTSHTM